MTRPNISFNMNKLSQFKHMPYEHHWGAVKRLFRLFVDTPLILHDFSYADCAGNPGDRTSTEDFLIFLGANPISWSSTKQHTIDHSFTEVEYHAIVTAAAELQWVKSLLLELLVLVQLPPTLFSNNLSATYLLANHVFHSRMKHLAIYYHFVPDLVQLFELRVVHVSVGEQLIDALTKPLYRSCLFSLCNKIGVISSIPS